MAGRSPTAHVLIVAGGGHQEALRRSLRLDGYAVSWADNCTDGIRSFKNSAPDIVVLYAATGNSHETAVLTEMAETRGIPVVVMGRGDTLEDQAQFLSRLARVDGLSPSRAVALDESERIVVGDVGVDVAGHVARVGERPLDLTEKEFELLCHLMRRPGWTWSRQQLLEWAWGYDFADPRVITVHIGNLRKKLAQAVRESSEAEEAGQLSRQTFIQTVRGVGYRFLPAAPEVDARTGATQTQPHAVPRRSSPTPFVGRDREMAALRQSFEDVLASHFRVAVLFGDAGIGKTRLAEEFCTYVRGRGGIALLGKCYDRPAGPAYAPWIEIFTQWESGRTPGELTEFFCRRPPYSHMAPRNSQRARLQYLEELTALLRTQAEAGPGCLVFDDLHWADTSTLLALQHVVRHLHEAPLMLVLIYRPTDSGRHALLTAVTAEIAQDERGLNLSLDPLAPREVEQFIHELGQTDTSARRFEHMASDIYELTEGNPLFLTQLMRLLLLRAEVSDFRLADLSLSREEGVRSVILQRLSGIPPASREWLETAAVFGREFTGSVVGESLGLSADLQAKAAEAAVDMHLVEAREDAPERYRFVHNLFREVLYDQLSPDRRTSLHALAGMVLERQAIPGPDTYSATLAHHYSAAAAAGYAQKGVEYCVRAGRIAASHYAWEEACGHWQRGLELMELLPVDTVERCPSFVGRLYEDLGDGQGLVGDSDRAIDAYERAARNLPFEETICLARVKRKQVQHFHNRGEHGRALAAIAQADALLRTPEEASEPDWWHEWIDIHHERVKLHFWAGETEEAWTLLQVIEPEAESHGTETQHAQQQLLKCWVDMRRRRFVSGAETIALAESCAARFIALGSPADIQDAQMVMGVSYLHSPAERGRAHEHLVCYAELAKQNHDLLNRMYALGGLSLWHRWRGDVEAVREYASGVLSLAFQRQIVSYVPEARGDLAWTAWRNDMTHEARALATAALEDLERQFPRSPFEWRVRWPLFGLSVLEGDLEQTALHAQAMLDPLQSKFPDELENQLARFIEQESRVFPERKGTAHRLVTTARALGYL